LDIVDIGQHHLSQIIENRLASIDAVRMNDIEGLIAAQQPSKARTYRHYSRPSVHEEERRLLS
jgi:hypothetical protein